MNKKYEEYWSALGIALGLNTDEIPLNWNSIAYIACKQRTLPILYHGLWLQGKEALLPDKLRAQMKKDTCYNSVIGFSRRMDLFRVLKAAVEQNIKMVCFKGYILADTYPEWKTRVSSDSDIYVYERDREKAQNLLCSLGYEIEAEKSKKQVPVYIHKERKHIIELHFSLWEDYEGKQIDILDNMKITNEKSLIQVRLEDMDIWTLSPTNHLIFQMFHIIKHFTVQGIGSRYMLDITFFVNRYIKEIDVPYFWNCMEQLHYTDFCMNYFSLCIEYLRLNEDILEANAMNCSESKKLRLLEDMMKFDKGEQNDYKVITLMSPYLEGRETHSGGSITRKLKLIFPSADALQDDFAYAKKHKILLPFAWVQKWCRFINNRIHGRSQSAFSKIEEADDRVAMMKEMNLLEK